MISSDIVITTLNARYHHASLGLRYLLANMGELKPRTRLREYVINERSIDILEDLLSYRPTIIGFGVYIWNIEETTKLIAMLKQIRPDICIIIGGPEVSYEYADLPITKLADHLLTGAADLSFAEHCHHKLSSNGVADKIIPAPSGIPSLSLPPGRGKVRMGVGTVRRHFGRARLGFGTESRCHSGLWCRLRAPNPHPNLPPQRGKGKKRGLSTSVSPAAPK